MPCLKSGAALRAVCALDSRIAWVAICSSLGDAHHQSPVIISVSTITVSARRENFENKPVTTTPLCAVKKTAC